MTWINKKSDDIFYIINDEDDLNTILNGDVDINNNEPSYGTIYNTNFTSKKYNYLIDKKIRYTDTTNRNAMYKVKINGYYYDTSNLKLPSGYTPFRLKSNYIHLKKNISNNLQIINAAIEQIPILLPLPTISIENQVNIVIRTK